MITEEYRPQRFEDIVGQDLVKKVMKSVVKNPEDAPRSIILQGPYGSGKSSCARVFARVLNCKGKGDDACLDCRVCNEDIQSSVFYREYDVAMIGNVEDMRELRGTFHYSISEGWKVIVFDECLDYDTNIRLADGTTRSIGKIVNNKEGVEVISYNFEERKFESKKVIGWHKKEKKQMNKYIFENDRKTFKLNATENHVVFNKKGKEVKLKDLDIGDKIRVVKKVGGKERVKNINNVNRRYKFSEEQKQVLYGTLLGDTSINKQQDEFDRNPRIKISHSEKQKDWASLKYNILEDIFRGGLRKVKNEGWGTYNYRAESKSLEELEEFYDLIKDKKNNRRLKKEILNKLKPLGIAVWFMDDGSHSVRKYWSKEDDDYREKIGSISFNTHRYSLEENKMIRDYFEKEWGIVFNIREDKRCNKYYLLSNSKEDAKKLLDIVSPYFVEEVLDYKIRPNHKPGNKLLDIEKGSFTENLDIEGNIYQSEYAKFKEVKDSGKRRTYDLTVKDNHNYIGADCLVHNCHLASKKAQSALLKEIEEAPNRVFFVFATTDIEGILNTIRSRSLEMRFELISQEDIKENIIDIAKKEEKEISDDIAELISLRSRGHMRNAHMMLDRYLMLGEEDFKESVRSAESLFLDYFYYLSNQNKDGVFKTIDDLLTFPLADLKLDFQNVLLDLTEILVGYKEGSEKEQKIVKSLGGKVLKLIKQGNWILDNFDSDLTFKACMLSLYQLLSGGKSKKKSSSSRYQRAKKK